MNMRAERFDYDPTVEVFVKNSRPLGDELKDVAEIVADEARRDAPVLTGRYRASIGTELERTIDGYVARAHAETRYAIFIERGTEDTPRFAPLREGLIEARTTPLHA